MVEEPNKKKSPSVFFRKCVSELESSEREFITVAQLAEILKIEPNSVLHYIRRYGIPKIRDPDDKRKWLIDKKALIRLFMKK